MKRYIALLLATMMLLCLAACGKKNDTAEEDAAPQMEDLTEIVYCDGSVVTRLALQDERWQWVDDPTFPLDQDAVQVLVDALPSLLSCDNLNSHPTDDELTSYGLKEPKRYLEAGGAHFGIGRQHTDGRWYMQTGDDVTVYAVPDEIVSLICRSIYDIMVLPTLPEWDASNVLVMTFSAGDEVVRSYVNFGEDGWKSGGANADDEAAILINDLASIPLLGCADYAPAEGAAEVCGLVPAVVSVSVTYSNGSSNDQQTTLSIGNLRSNDNCRYLTIGEDPTIYLVPQESLVSLLQAAGVEE